MKKFLLALALAIFLHGLMTPALSMSVSISGGTGTDSISTSTNYNLDDSTRLQEHTMLSESEVFQSREASGSGHNLIDQSVGGKGYSVNNVIDSSGSFSTSASTAASGDGIGLSQSLVGSGDLSSSLDGNTARGSSSQISEVTSGALSTKQTLAAARGIYADQSTKLSGEAGGIGSSSSSSENDIIVAGGFSGQGNLEADLSAMASDGSFVGGDASFQGVSVLDDEKMQTLNSDDLGYSVEGLYALPEGDIGTFGLRATNQDNGGIGIDTSSLLSRPATTSTGGNSAAYLLQGWKWVQKDPQIKLYLLNDAALRNEGLNPTATQGALAAAANTWDAATNQNLFADANLVTVTSDPKITSAKYDHKNTIAFKQFGSNSNAMASAGTWFQTKKVNGYYPIVESDITFNTKFNWGINNKYKADFQSVALHELGHTIGLGDLYGKSQFAKDTRQVMHYYTGVKRTLGNGDATGVWKLYG